MGATGRGEPDRHRALLSTGNVQPRRRGEGTGGRVGVRRMHQSSSARSARCGGPSYAHTATWGAKRSTPYCLGTLAAVIRSKSRMVTRSGQHSHSYRAERIRLSEVGHPGLGPTPELDGYSPLPEPLLSPLATPDTARHGHRPPEVALQ